MIRKLTVTLGLVLTSSLVLAASAFAVVPADSGSGAASSTSGGDGFPWLGASIGVTLALLGVALLAGVAGVSRTRRTALQS